MTSVSSSTYTMPSDYTIPSNYPPGCPTGQTTAVSSSASRFWDMVTTLRQRAASTQNATSPAAPAVPGESSATAPVSPTAAPSADAYKAYLEQRFGPVTIQSIPKDQDSLEAAGKRMSGRDVVIAPNIFAEMVADPQKAAHYEQKISYFFTDVIPNGKAFAASVGLTFEPCGVVIHEDGTVTYICGGGDTPERVAEVNRINREKAAKKAAQQKQRQTQAAEAAARSRAIRARAALAKPQEPVSFAVGDLLKARILAAPTAVSAVALPAEVLFLDL